MLLLSLLPLVHAAIHPSIPEDLHAFPKYRLAFLHRLPLLNDTAQRWLRDGLRGGEPEFLDEWQSAKGIDPGEEYPFRSDHHHSPLPEPSPALQHMRLGPSKAYLCLIPPAPVLPPSPPDDPHAPLTPSHSWSLLQPLSGTCLYHRQAWFTYSYCHNLHVRQFRELPATFPHPPGARVIEEDPEWESYTLGKSSAAHTVDGRLAVNDELALANNLELARQAAGQRYLVQRWSDGTVCDKTGRPREIEIQFHCSMTMTDTILFVKETRTCEYVLVIHTPRLCGEPGFKSRLEQMPEAPIRCREIVDSLDGVDPTLPDAPHAVQPRSRKPLPTPQRAPEGDANSRDTVDRAQDTAKLLRKALESLLGRANIEDVALFEVQQGEQEGEFYVAIDAEAPETDQGEPVATGRGASLEAALRQAGYNIKGEKKDEKKDKERDEL